MIPRISFLFLLVVGLVLSGCLSKRTPAPASIPPGPWALVELAGRPVSVTDALRQPTLRFDAATGGVSGNAGVNRLNGTFTQTETALTFGPVAVTRMAGPPELMQLEAEFLAVLPQVRRWRLETTWLTLLAEDGTVLAQFVPGQVQ